MFDLFRRLTWGMKRHNPTAMTIVIMSKALGCLCLK